MNELSKEDGYKKATKITQDALQKPTEHKLKAKLKRCAQQVHFNTTLEKVSVWKFHEIELKNNQEKCDTLRRHTYCYFPSIGASPIAPL